MEPSESLYEPYDSSQEQFVLVGAVSSVNCSSFFLLSSKCITINNYRTDLQNTTPCIAEQIVNTSQESFEIKDLEQPDSQIKYQFLEAFEYAADKVSKNIGLISKGWVIGISLKALTTFPPHVAMGCTLVYIKIQNAIVESFDYRDAYINDKDAKTLSLQLPLCVVIAQNMPFVATSMLITAAASIAISALKFMSQYMDSESIPGSLIKPMTAIGNFVNDVAVEKLKRSGMVSIGNEVGSLPCLAGIVITVAAASVVGSYLKVQNLLLNELYGSYAYKVEEKNLVDEVLFPLVVKRSIQDLMEAKMLQLRVNAIYADATGFFVGSFVKTGFFNKFNYSDTQILFRELTSTMSKTKAIIIARNNAFSEGVTTTLIAFIKVGVVKYFLDSWLLKNQTQTT